MENPLMYHSLKKEGYSFPQKSSTKIIFPKRPPHVGILFPLDHPIFQIQKNTIHFCREAIDFRPQTETLPWQVQNPQPLCSFPPQ